MLWCLHNINYNIWSAFLSLPQEKAKFDFMVEVTDLINTELKFHFEHELLGS